MHAHADLYMCMHINAYISRYCGNSRNSGGRSAELRVQLKIGVLAFIAALKPDRCCIYAVKAQDVSKFKFIV